MKIDLSTEYLGLELKSPLVASSSPLTEKHANVRRLEDAGAAAIVFHSLFEEQINHESQVLDTYLSQGTESFAESLSYFPEQEDYKLGPEEYLNAIAEAKRAVDVPIIGSLNGVSSGGWIEYAKKIEQAGADALELNIYFLPTDPHVSGAEVEQQYVTLVHDVAQTVRIPVAVKLSPGFSAPANMAVKLDEAGAKGLVLFNRFYQPDIDLEELVVVPNLAFSRTHELRQRLRWTAIIYGTIKADIAITGGVHTGNSVIKCMMVGAKAAMMTSALLQNGMGHFEAVKKDMLRWMEEHEYESIQIMQGSMSHQHVENPAAFERANYLKVLGSYRSGV